MSPLNYIRIQAEILMRQDLKPNEKLVLGLIAGFHSKGLHCSNQRIADLLGIKPDTVTKLLMSMSGKGLIHIKNPQSRYRQIFYSGCLSGVEGDSTEDICPATQDIYPVYSGQTSEHKVNKVIKQKKKSFSLPVENKITPVKIHSDPEKMKRVFADLGFETPESEAI